MFDSHISVSSARVTDAHTPHIDLKLSKLFQHTCLHFCYFVVTMVELKNMRNLPP